MPKLQRLTRRELSPRAQRQFHPSLLQGAEHLAALELDAEREAAEIDTQLWLEARALQEDLDDEEEAFEEADDELDGDLDEEADFDEDDEDDDFENEVPTAHHPLTQEEIDEIVDEAIEAFEARLRRDASVTDAAEEEDAVEVPEEAPASGGGGWLRALLGGGLAVGAMALANAYVRREQSPLKSVLSESPQFYPFKYGRVAYAVAGAGEPVLLIHGIGAGASSFEFRCQMDELAETRRVYAIDLLGFGLSDRPEMRYTAELYVELLRDFIRDVIGTERPIDAVASSAASAYLTQLAFAEPNWFRRLVMICPTGVRNLDQSKAIDRAIRGALLTPVVGEAFYNGLTSRLSIERTLRRDLYCDPERVTPALVDYYHTAAHQPGAMYPIASFLTDHLDLDVEGEFSQLTQPVLIAWGQEATLTPLTDVEPYLTVNPKVQLQVFAEARQLPHVERSEGFNAALTRFLSGDGHVASEAAVPAMAAVGIPSLDQAPR